MFRTADKQTGVQYNTSPLHQIFGSKIARRVSLPWKAVCSIIVTSGPPLSKSFRLGTIFRIRFNRTGKIKRQRFSVELVHFGSTYSDNLSDRVFIKVFSFLGPKRNRHGVRQGVSQLDIAFFDLPAGGPHGDVAKIVDAWNETWIVSTLLTLMYYTFLLI